MSHELKQAIRDIYDAVFDMADDVKYQANRSLNNDDGDECEIANRQLDRAQKTRELVAEFCNKLYDDIPSEQDIKDCISFYEDLGENYSYDKSIRAFEENGSVIVEFDDYDGLAIKLSNDEIIGRAQIWRDMQEQRILEPEFVSFGKVNEEKIKAAADYFIKKQDKCDNNGTSANFILRRAMNIYAHDNQVLFYINDVSDEKLLEIAHLITSKKVDEVAECFKNLAENLNPLKPKTRRNK